MKKFKNLPRPQKHHIPLLVVSSIALIAAIGLFVTIIKTAPPVGSGNMYLSERSQSATSGQDITYTVRIDPQNTVDTVTATLAYDPEGLTFKSVDHGDSPFNVQIPAIETSGSVMIQAAQFNGAVSDDSFIARVTFTATRDGNHSVKLEAGNAAHAGEATYPALDGVAQHIEDNATSTPPAKNPVSGAAQSVLRTAGVSPASARHASPWLIALTVALIAIIPAALLKKPQAKRGSKQSSRVTHPRKKDKRS